jgi:hypothetical protein
MLRSNTHTKLLPSGLNSVELNFLLGSLSDQGYNVACYGVAAPSFRFTILSSNSETPTLVVDQTKRASGILHVLVRLSPEATFSCAATSKGQCGTPALCCWECWLLFDNRSWVNLRLDQASKPQWRLLRRIRQQYEIADSLVPRYSLDTPVCKYYSSYPENPTNTKLSQVVPRFGLSHMQGRSYCNPR